MKALTILLLFSAASFATVKPLHISDNWAKEFESLGITQSSISIEYQILENCLPKVINIVQEHNISTLKDITLKMFHDSIIETPHSSAELDLKTNKIIHINTKSIYIQPTKLTCSLDSKNNIIEATFNDIELDKLITINNGKLIIKETFHHKQRFSLDVSS